MGTTKLHIFSKLGTINKPLALLVGAVITTGLSSTAWSAEPQPVVQIDKVMVNATRIKQQLSKVPRPIAVVSKTELEIMQPQSVPEVLTSQPNITIMGGPRPNNQTVNIRGLSGNEILQTVDGVRQAFESGHRPSYFVDPALLKSVEVIKGPASSLWGSGALGGVVAQNTISAGDLLLPSQTLGGFAKTSYNFNDDQSTTTIATAGRADTVDWLLSGYYRDSNDLELGNGNDLVGSADRNKGVLAKLEWQINDDQAVTFNVRHSNDDGNVPSNGTAKINSMDNPLINRNSQTDNVSVDYHINTASPLVNGQVLAYWHQVEMDERRVSDGRKDNTQLDVIGLNVNNQSSLGTASLLYGIDGYRESFDAQRGGSNRPVPPDADTNVWGSFAQLTLPFAGSLSLDLGLRYDYFDTKANNLHQDRSDDKVSPSVALTWNTTDWLSLVVRYDEAFRAPSSEELYSSGTHFCMGAGFCNTFVANPNLKPEQAANTELLAKMHFANLLGNDLLTINSSVFHNNVDDFIEMHVDDPDFTAGNPGHTSWNNVDEAEINGFEFAADYQLNAYRMKLAYGQSRGADNKTGDYLTNIPADTLTADLSYGFLQRQLTTGLRLLAASDQDRTQDKDTTYHSYNVVDLYADWEPTAIKALKLNLAVNNLADKHYRRAWDNLDAAGREVIVSAKYKF